MHISSPITPTLLTLHTPQNVKEEPKPLPIISPIMAAPDEKQTMGFFTGN